MEHVIQPKDMKTPAWRFHKLNGNWHRVFRFNDKDAIEVDYLDYP